MANPTITQLDDRELENQTVDVANFPYQKMRAMLYWNGSAWVKWPGYETSRQVFPTTPTAFTATTSVTSILAADATYGLDLVSINIENNSATATEVILYKDDGSTEVERFYVPAGDMRGKVWPAGREKTQGAINKAWKAKTVTSVSSVYISLDYIKNTAWSA
jgi:hypothetical protein